MLKDKRILLGITGGIAAYKSVDLASKLTKSGAVVKTVMTRNACEFISPLLLKSITHQSVSVEQFNLNADIEHISLADWAELLVIAPATANIIGKAAGGIADDLLSTIITATISPILFVPAMNVHMYENKIVQRNIEILKKYGYFFAEPETGKLACGYEGKGRFPQVEEIIYHIKTYLNYKGDLIGKKILVTAGATRENIDPMRFISNYSSGKTGLALARAAFLRGAEVKFVAASVNENIPDYLDFVKTENAAEMYETVMKLFPDYETVIMAAAVSDYTPESPAERKIKKGENLSLKLRRTNDILAEMGKRKGKNQKLIGFAAESENIEKNALVKLEKKNLDFIVANDLKVAGKQETEIILIGKDFRKKITGDKFEVAHSILDEIFGSGKGKINE
ncbi:MAG: bifunctional phosphopantothenoylcysteine decarboxylase/phosphopantothenate--cysteine ligase CoaBC [Candidatus Cloacimonadota bacterium]|nr:MAG: bifunctional phosphopantothenoylcysteine decarboxylase/phosphopantothenate--cysteine ligase CoaBC [Candidatus Cloacimonadota bacterium]